jgi:hypothetical protein
MFFVPVMEILDTLIQKADEWAIFSWLGVQSINNRTSLYADDFIMFLSPTPTDLELTKKHPQGVQGGIRFELQPIQMPNGSDPL